MVYKDWDYLDELASEAAYIIREAFAQFKKPVILFSGGKDSIVLTHLAIKAFHPLPMPIPLLQVDTGHNFPEAIAFRDAFVARFGLKLLIASVQESIDKGRVVEEPGINTNRNLLQTQTLLDFIHENGIDCAFGGGRRDEEKARAKERFFSHRNTEGRWDPERQNPEFWPYFNGSLAQGGHFRVFPLSNFTELDIWHFIQRNQVQLPELYFSKVREVVFRNGTWLPNSPFISLLAHEKLEQKKIRFRTLGDITITGGIESEAHTVEDIIEEIKQSEYNERGHRADDMRSDSSMEDRKREGYF